jgi:IS5 family transposase
MYRREHRDQLSFKDFFLSFGGQLSGDNRWIKLAELIPWDELEGDYAAQFCKGFGAPAKPFRMALGALIIKARLDLTDEELVEKIKRISISSSSLAWRAINIQHRLIRR